MGGLKSLLLEFCYPVGSYFYSNSSNFDTVAKVQAHFGGTWTKLGDGYFVEAGSSITTHSAGLPNIGGDFTCNRLGINEDGYPLTAGAFGGTFKNIAEGQYGSQMDPGRHPMGFTFSAASGEIHNGGYSNLIYGKSDTVQPKSRTAYVYYRTA